MLEQRVRIGAAAGLHARPAAVFVTAVLESGAAIRIGRPGGETADARSIVSVLALDLKHGEEAVLALDLKHGEEAVDPKDSGEAVDPTHSEEAVLMAASARILHELANLLQRTEP